MSPPGHPWVSKKNFIPIGPAVWPAIGNIYTNVLFYYIDVYKNLLQYLWTYLYSLFLVWGLIESRDCLNQPVDTIVFLGLILILSLKRWEEDTCEEWEAIPWVQLQGRSQRTIIYPLWQSGHIILLQEIFL